jgi:hypothetical protein
MTTTRFYLPLNVPGLAEAVSTGTVVGLAEGFVADDTSEEAEYAALVAAADASAGLLAGLPDGARRRVVVVVEAEDHVGHAPWSQVVAVHADTADDTDTDEDLGWFATQEVDDLLAL